MKTHFALTVLSYIVTTFSTIAANANLSVHVSVDYTAPKFFDRRDPYYLAGSPLTLTCKVQDGGAAELNSFFYEWTSTCSDVCFTLGKSTSTVSVSYLESSDNGVHTCTVYGAHGEMGSDNVTINVVGAAIRVSDGNVLSNNSIIFASSLSNKMSEFRCISGSNQSHVGRLIGVSGRDITVSRLDPFFIYRGDPGVVRVRSARALRSSEQGIYTCRIPDETGVTVDLNVGLCLSGNIVPMSFTKTDYKSNGDYYLITFTTTGSPPTSVVWTRDDIIIEEGDELYVASQELIDRTTSTYNNYLKIYGTYEDAVGEYVCTATNAINTITGNETVKAFTVSGYEDTILVGLSTVLRCSTILDVVSIEWYQYGILLNSSSTSSVEYVVRPQTAGLNGAWYTCYAQTVSGENYTETVTVSVKELTNVVTIDGPSNPLLAGGFYEITCSATVDVTPTLMWTDEIGNPIKESKSISLSGPTVSGDVTKLSLIFDSLLTSQAGTYSCVSIVNVPKSVQRAVRDIKVQIPQPQVTLTSYPDTTTLFTTQSFQITCHTYLHSSIDTSVGVAHTWSGPSGVLSSNGYTSITGVIGSDQEFNSTLSISSLRSSDSGTYTCFSNVSSQSSSSYIVSSESTSASLSINASLKTTIQIDYTPPDQYPDYAPPYYRAASSVTLRCVVEGARGSVSYRWSSTCRSCTASGYTSSSFTESMLTTRHAGVHTCTVTDSIGNTGSNSTQMNIYGAGIYVSYSYGYGGRQAAQPNNSFVNLYSRSGYYDSGQVIQLYCCSNRSSSYIGSFTEPYGSTYSSSFNSFTVDRYSSSSTYYGCIRLYGYKHYYSYFSYNQGVYMCNIPDSTGTTVRVNFALYSSSVRNVPTISSFEYSMSSLTNASLTLTCYTRTSPPTEITWRRNGVYLTLNDSTTEMIQTVTDRYSYFRYSNVLNIYDEPDNLVGNYTCTVGNSVGYRTSTVITIAGISLTSDYDVAVVGSSITFTCSSDLDPISVQWYIDESLVSETPGDYDTITNDIISTDDEGAIYTCSIISDYGSQQESITLDVVVPDDWATIEITNANGDPLHNYNYTAICSVHAIEGMNIIPSISWYHPNGTVVVTGGHLTVGQIQIEGTLTSLSLTFSPVFNDDGGLYTCIAGVTVPWMSTQPPAVTGTVNMIITTQSMFQLKMGPMSHCSTWDSDYFSDKAYALERSIKHEIQKAVKNRCNCNFLSTSIYSGEFSCQTTTTEVIYRAIINGSSDLLTATQLMEYIEDWKTNKGTLLYNVFRLRLSQSCPLRIESFDELECRDEEEQKSKQKVDSMSSTLLAQDGCFKLQACDGNSKYSSTSGLGLQNSTRDNGE